MIALKDIVEQFADRELFITPKGVVTYREFGEMTMDSDGLVGASLFGGLNWNPGAMAGLVTSLLKHEVTLLCSLPESANLKPFLENQPLLVLKSGGTMGEPKHVVHSVDRLFGKYEILDRPCSRNLILFEADHIAGLDAFFQALHRGATLVFPDSRDAFGIVQAIQDFEVEVLPATPTFLQFLLLSGALEEKVLKSVKTIPHGAEPMLSELRRRIQRAFPRARLVQRFGLTELGALPVKEDPMDPSALVLEGAGYSWKIEDGELLIQAPTRMLGTLEDGPIAEPDGWHHTGDFAEFSASGSVRILGRRETMINVGGSKVLPETVEDFLLHQEGVLDVAVYPEPSLLTGQAVAADIVFEQDPVPAIWLRGLRKRAIIHGLELTHVPTHVRPVKQIQLNRIGKRLRRSVKT